MIFFSQLIIIFYKRIRKNEFSLTMILTENNCKENGIHISFLTTEKIIINNYQEKVKKFSFEI